MLCFGKVLHDPSILLLVCSLFFSHTFVFYNLHAFSTFKIKANSVLTLHNVSRTKFLAQYFSNLYKLKYLFIFYTNFL